MEKKICPESKAECKNGFLCLTTCYAIQPDFRHLLVDTSNVKTAEEILSPLRGKGNFINCVDYEDALKAMEEYRNQSPLS